MDTLRAALDALPLPKPVAYRCWHPKATRCFHLSTEPPSERRTDTGERDEWFGGMVKELVYAEAIRAAHRDGARLALERSIALCDVTPPYPFRPSIEAAHAIRELLKELGND